MVLLGVAVPHQDGQEIGDVGVGRMEVAKAAHDVGFAQSAVADGNGEQGAGVQLSPGHGKVLALTKRTGRIQQARNLARQVTQ